MEEKTEIKITIQLHDTQCELPVEVIIEKFDINDLSPEKIPNYSSENEFFENYEQGKVWIKKKLEKTIESL